MSSFRFAASALFVLALGSTGCAAVFKGSKQEVKLAAAPEKVDVRADGKWLGAAPVTIELPRDRDQYLRFTKEGYEEQQIVLRRRGDAGWFVWDIATCVLPVTLCIPLFVDALTGAWYSFDDDFRVKLEPATARPAPAAPAAPPAATPPAPPPSPPAETSSPAGY